MTSAELELLITKAAHIIAEQMNHIAQQAQSEEDVRHECNKLIDDFIKKVGLKIKGQHEYGLAGGRIDSKYAGVIIEYKSPKGSGKITEQPSAPGTKAVVEKIKQRFQDFQREEHVAPEKLFGVGTDGDTLVFVRQPIARAIRSRLRKRTEQRSCSISPWKTGPSCSNRTCASIFLTRTR